MSAEGGAGLVRARAPEWPRGPFQRTSVSVRSRSREKAVLLALIGLGYTKIRWRTEDRGVFNAFDEHRIATVIVIDVSPVEDGYPVPRLSPRRASDMRDLCATYLQDHLKTRKVRADYIALPESRAAGSRLTLTQRRGVAWAFAKDRPSAHVEGEPRAVTCA